MVARLLAVFALVALSVVAIGCASNDPSPGGSMNPPSDEGAPITGGALFDMN